MSVHYIRLSEGNIVVGAKEVKSEVIETLADGTQRLFADLSDHHQVDNWTSVPLGSKYNTSDNTYIEPGVDSNGNPKWFDTETGALWQNTYDENNNIIGEELSE